MVARALPALGLAALSQVLALQPQDLEHAEENRTRRGSCDCLSWAEVYYNNEAFCGRGNELYFLSRHGFSAAYAAIEPITGLPHKVCHDFFLNWLDPSCVNFDLLPFPPDGKTGQQWCYVSNDCNQLNGGGYSTNQQGFAQSGWHNLQSQSFQAWKICDPGGTEALASMPVLEVVEKGRASDVPLSRLLRLAYPVVEIGWGHAHYLWEAINDQYEATRTVAEMVDLAPNISGWGTDVEEAWAALRSIAKSGQATILDSIDHGDNFHVVEGRAAYSVTRVINGNAIYLSGHFSEEFEVTCLMGCASGNRDSVDMETM